MRQIERHDFQCHSITQGQGQGHGASEVERKWPFSKSICSAIDQAMLNSIDDYYTMGQYPNFVGTLFSFSLSFSFYEASNLKKNVVVTAYSELQLKLNRVIWSIVIWIEVDKMNRTI